MDYLHFEYTVDSSTIDSYETNQKQFQLCSSQSTPRCYAAAASQASVHFSTEPTWGRTRKVRTADEEREYNARRKEQLRLAQQRRRRNNPEYVAREVERKRQARRQDPEYAAREAERMRRMDYLHFGYAVDRSTIDSYETSQEQFQLCSSQSTPYAAATSRASVHFSTAPRGRPRKVRTAEEELEYNARRKEQQRLAQQRRRQNNPEYVAREAERKRQARRQDPEYAAREAERSFERELERKRRARRDRNSERRNAEYAAKRRLKPRLLEPSPAAKYASSRTEASFLAGRGYSLSQCGVLPVVSKSSQADLKPKLKSVGVQTQHGRKKLSAGLVRRKSAAAGMSTRSQSRSAETADVALRLLD